MHNKLAHKKGFTLIELLIVIAIIGILAGIFLSRIGDFRTRAEDARRIADVRHVQTVLELYYNACHNYPVGGTICSASDGTAIPAPAVTYTDRNGWSQLQNTIAGKVSNATLPQDSNQNKSYKYWSDGVDYVLNAALANANAVTKDNVVDGHGLTCDSSNFCVGSSQ